MSVASLLLLGGFELTLSSGAPVILPRRKAQALLAYLACHPGQAHRRDKLAALLWPEAKDRLPRHSLRQALVALRQAFPAAPLGLRIDEDTVELDASVLLVDVLAFERLACEGTPEALHRVAELYRGDLLEGLGMTEAPFEEWLVGERERLRELALAALA